MTDLEAKAREVASRHGLICLIPANKDSITSHEHTLCDCQVIAMLSEALREARNSALEEAAGVADREFAESDSQVRTGVMPIAIRDGWTARRACAEAIAARIRALKDTTP